MSRVRLGDEAPNFTAESTEGDINFHDWIGDSWAILFSHPADYTPVCTTELGAVAKYKDEFDKRNVKVVALSVDGLKSHHGWIKDINETQSTTINFPIIADPDRKVAVLYDMIHPNADSQLTVRSVFVIDPNKKVKLTLTIIDSLQLTAYYKVATPANWKNGDNCVIVPSVTNEEVESLFPQGHVEVKPYLRITPQPNLDWD